MRRHNKIGGSDVGAILGLNPHKRPIDVFAEIVEGATQTPTFAMRRGILMEPVVRTMYQEETGHELLGSRVVESKKHDFLIGSLDDVAVVGGMERVVEYKTANIRQAHLWGDGADEIPPAYLAQVHTYMLVTELPASDVAVFLGGDSLHIYTIERDEEFQGLITEACGRFWVDHVLPKRPPPPDSSDSYSGWLSKRFPAHESAMIQADAEAQEWAKRLAEARERKKAAEEEEALARNNLIAKIGGAEGLLGAGWRVSYKATKGRASVNWDALCVSASIPKSLVEQHTTRTPYRQFRFSGGKDE